MKAQTGNVLLVDSDGLCSVVPKTVNIGLDGRPVRICGKDKVSTVRNIEQSKRKNVSRAIEFKAKRTSTKVVVRRALVALLNDQYIPQWIAVFTRLTGLTPLPAARPAAFSVRTTQVRVALFIVGTGIRCVKDPWPEVRRVPSPSPIGTKGNTQKVTPFILYVVASL